MAEKNPGQKYRIGKKEKQGDLAEGSASEGTVDVLYTSSGQLDKEPVTIAGIGFSAGGLEAFAQLLEGLPGDTTGMAFVLAGRPDTKHGNLSIDSFSKVTSMPVLEVDKKMTVKADHIYIAPAGKAMSVSGGDLTLVAGEDAANQNTPADTFLMSLAKDRGSGAIGVILSGTAADGARGLNDIKKTGGVTFAQKPQTAKFEGMPLNAIATGSVDYILSPKDIAVRLVQFASFNSTNSGGAGNLGLFSADELNRIFFIVRKATGMDFSEYRKLTMKRRILRRMFLHKLEKPGDYANYLQENPVEIWELYHDMLINVTSFFRDPDVFETLKRDVFPVLMVDKASTETFRVWVPGCSTGEEAYSIAMVCIEFFEGINFNPPIQIFATDVNDNLIDKARAGIYPRSIEADVATDRLRRFFTRVENGYQISKKVRDMCIFARQDMVKDPPFSRIDLISCRNAVIYFSQALQKKLFPVLHYALRKQGFLLLGVSESVGAFSNLFHLVDKKYKIYSKKAVPTPLIPSFTARELAATSMETCGSRFEQSGSATGTKYCILEEADRIVLNKYAPAGLVINSNLEIIHYRGLTCDYLKHPPGVPTVELRKMLREGLSFGLLGAINKAKKGGNPVREEGLEVFHDGLPARVNVEVIPFGAPHNKEKYFLILFEKTVLQARLNGKDTGAAVELEQQTKDGEDKQLNKLRHELNAAREYLHSVTDQYKSANEELRAAYEEIQSCNEELQSMNEELETTKEELQSTNEELVALNNEAQKRNHKLSEISSDLLNLFRSINIPVIMLNNDLKIRRFNPTAEKLFNLIPSDIGRPITDINTNFNNANLEKAILEVTDTLVSMEKEAQDRRGNWYSVQIRPFRTVENKIDGVIITYIDIEPVKRLALTEEVREYARVFVETVRQPLLVLDGDLCVKLANKAFYMTFMVMPEQTLDKSIFDLGNGQWDIPQMRILLEGILPRSTKFENLEIVYEFPQIGKKRIMINARRLISPGDKTKMIIIAIEYKD